MRLFLLFRSVPPTSTYTETHGLPLTVDGL
jgi:hypothetical protein